MIEINSHLLDGPKGLATLTPGALISFKLKGGTSVDCQVVELGALKGEFITFAGLVGVGTPSEELLWLNHNYSTGEAWITGSA